LRIKDIQIYEIDLKLRRPYKISYKTTDVARNLLIAIRTEEGLVGYGQAAQVSYLSDTRENAFAFLKSVTAILKDKDPCDIAGIHKHLEMISKKTGYVSPGAEASIDYACYDLLGKLQKKPVYELLGSSSPRIVPTSIGLGIESPEDLVKGTEEYLQEFNDNGPWLIKLKLDGKPEMDLKRVFAVGEIFPRGIKLDPNQAYTDPKIAVKTFNELYASFGSKIALIEEPCPRGELQKTKYVAENTEIPVYADESAVTLEDVRTIIKEQAADGVNIKLPKMGGIYWAAEAARLLEEANLKAQVGCMVGSRVGLAAAANFAAGISNVSHTDIDADIYFKTNIGTDQSLPFVWGARMPSGKVGLGIDFGKEFGSILNEDVSIRKLL
jgi:L-alanine-DL-glutamate epimerase-like enolase superfamily enzyme